MCACARHLIGNDLAAVPPPMIAVFRCRLFHFLDVDTGSFEGCRLKYNPPLVEEPLALDPHSKIISDPRPLSNLRSMMESRTTPHHI